MKNSLPPWVRKWWDVANERRGTLINKKYLGKSPGLTKAQEQEFDLLQRVAGDVLDVYSPPCVPRASALTDEEIEAALAKGRAGAKELDKKLDAVFRPPAGGRRLQSGQKEP